MNRAGGGLRGLGDGRTDKGDIETNAILFCMWKSSRT